MSISDMYISGLQKKNLTHFAAIANIAAVDGEINADHEIDEPEAKLIYKYALGLGCSEDRAKEVIAKSIKIFGGGLDFEDYQYLINKN